MAPGPKDRWDKADIVGKWVTGLIGSALLLLLSYCVNQSSQRIANAQKNAALVADLIKDLSDTARVRKELALIALSYAVPKDESTTGASDLVAKVCEHMLLTDTLRSQAGFTLTLLQERDSLRARAVVDSLARASVEIARAVSGPRTESDTGRRTLPVIPAVVQNLSKGVVYIQFYGKGNERRDRDAMERLRQALNGRRFVAPGVDSVSTRVANGVRFFNESDRATADSVASIIAEVLPALGRVPVTKPSYRGSQGLIEVWLDLTAVPDSKLAARR